MDKLDQIYEQFKVHGQDLANKVGELIHEGNVRRIIIKDERGHTFMEIPLTVAAIRRRGCPDPGSRWRDSGRSFEVRCRRGAERPRLNRFQGHEKAVETVGQVLDRPCAR